MKKQILLLVLMLLPMVASADAVEIDGIYYNLLTKGQAAEVTRKSSGSYSGDIVIPEKVSYNGAEYCVTSISSSAFSFCTDLTSITIPEGVTSIGDHTFSGCTGLTSVDIPSSVTSIGYSAFSSCSGLTSVIIPNSVISIGQYAFYNCSGLTSVTIPNGVTSIGDYAFYNCRSLSSITIPDGVTSIGSYAFHYCSCLKSIYLPNSIKVIGDMAFYMNGWDNSKTSVHISDLKSWFNIHFLSIESNPIAYSGHLYVNNMEIKDLVVPDGVESINQSAFYAYNLTSLTIPASVKSIGSYAFRYSTSLNTIIIKEGISEIGYCAFEHCGMTDFYCYAEQVPTTDSHAFLSSNIENATLHVPEASVSLYLEANPWNKFKNIEAIKPKCATPIIVMNGDKLKFTCNTKDVKYVYQATPVNETSYDDAEGLSLPSNYRITVYATKEGYENSETVTQEIDIKGKKGDVNGDGKVSITDAVSVVNIILNQGGENAAPARGIQVETENTTVPE